jgi:ParB family transcriptional regulator, chromosome partitioning protein
MTQKSVPLAALVLPNSNPRRTFNKSGIKGLAESIRTDGVLQNLIVEKNGDGTYRIRGGKRRFLALTLLKKKGVIDGSRSR